jgi:hypothetical protein
VDLLRHTLLVFNNALHPGVFFTVAICYPSFSLYPVPYKTLKDMKHLLVSGLYVTYWTNIYLNNYVYLGAALWR